MPTNPAFGTPTLTVRSNRRMPVRTLRYNRTPADETLKEYIERTTYDALGRVTSRVDARFFGAAGSPTPNFAYLSSLSGRVLRTDSIDAGTHWALADLDGRPAWMCDGRGTTTTFTYDGLGRPLTVQETFDKQTPAIRDRWIYGETQPGVQVHNLRGRLVYHYDTAGQLRWSGFRLTGQPVDETRQLLADAEGDADWSGQTPADLAGALDAAPYQTAWTHDATGTWVTQTDAKGNVQQRGFDVAGRLASSSLTLAGGTAKPVLSAIDYSAAGQVLSETAGNGVVSTHAYEPETQRLIGLTVTRPAQAGRATVVQDLSYVYDPVGNVVQICDAAQATSYWRNQKIQAAHTYVYDALYQLVSASGREMANRGQQAQGLPPATIPLPTDDSVYANYSRTYTYDPGGNLAAIQHQGAANYTQAIVVSDASNHALLQNGTATLTPANIDDGKNTWFDAAGNQQRLVPDATQTLAWDGRNRLRRVPLVSRPQDVNTDDRETYQYGGDGMRVRKRTTTQANSVTRTVDAIYLPGLTLRITASGDVTAMTVIESLQEVTSEAGSIQARCLHWETGQPTGLANDLLRYGMGDLQGSISLELDEQAALISREEYYPYGGTAIWAARSLIEADTKFVRYSGKERDATGLYYYGHRYYQPWIGRWLSSDPAGAIDGMNLYRMVRNNPMTFIDRSGLSGRKPGSRPSSPVVKLEESDTEPESDVELDAATGIADPPPGRSNSDTHASLPEVEEAAPQSGSSGFDYPIDPKYVTNPIEYPTFLNWTWVVPGKLARGSAPNYKVLKKNSDITQSVTAETIQTLKRHNVTGVVSLNTYPLPPEQIEALDKEGIKYLWLQVKDYTAPSRDQLIEGSEFIENNTGPTLVYCGLGAGRTGTQITAWEIYSGTKSVDEAIKDSSFERPEQEEVLRSMPRRGT